MSARVLAIFSLLLLTVGCEDEFAAPPVTCDLALDNLVGSTWVMLEAKPDKTEVPNPMARAKFIEEGGALKAMYTVKSLGDVYTYDCNKSEKGDEWLCRENSRSQDFCQALEVNEADSCTPEKLKEVGVSGYTDEEIAKTIAEAKATVAKFRDGEQWEQFKLNNNTLANKLQGMLDVKVKQRACNLQFTDMYATVYNGKRIEDSNPVGTNAFVRSEDEFLWEHCADGMSTFDLNSAERPEQPARGAVHALGDTVYYHYFGEKNIKAEEGCTYSMDTFAQWRPVEKDVAVAPVDGVLYWAGSHKWESLQDQPVGVYHQVRRKQCADGKAEQIDVVCNATKIR